MILVERDLSDAEIASHASWLGSYEQFDGEKTYKVGLHWPDVEYETFGASTVILSSEDDGGSGLMAGVLKEMFLSMHRNALSFEPERFSVAWRVRPIVSIHRFGCEECQDGPYKYAFWVKARCRLAFVWKGEAL